LKPKATILQGAIVQLFWFDVNVFPKACANPPVVDTAVPIAPLKVLPPLDARL
jgi:hypothetical protein